LIFKRPIAESGISLQSVLPCWLLCNVIHIWRENLLCLSHSPSFNKQDARSFECHSALTDALLVGRFFPITAMVSTSKLGGKFGGKRRRQASQLACSREREASWGVPDGVSQLGCQRGRATMALLHLCFLHSCTAAFRKTTIMTNGTSSTF